MPDLIQGGAYDTNGDRVVLPSAGLAGELGTYGYRPPEHGGAKMRHANDGLPAGSAKTDVVEPGARDDVAAYVGSGRDGIAGPSAAAD